MPVCFCCLRCRACIYASLQSNSVDLEQVTTYFNCFAQAFVFSILQTDENRKGETLEKTLFILDSDRLHYSFT